MKECAMCGKPLLSIPANRKYCGSQGQYNTCSYIANKLAQHESAHRLALERAGIRKIKSRPCALCGNDIIAPNNVKYCGHRYKIGTCAYEASHNYCNKAVKEEVAPKAKEAPKESLTPRMERLMLVERLNKNAASYMYVNKSTRMQIIKDNV